MSRAIFYLTYNGIFNNTNGIGTQAKTFLGGMTEHYAALCETFGEFAVHLVGPMPDEGWWGYSAQQLAAARAAVARLGGAVHLCPYRTYTDEFWTPESWLAVSTNAAATVLAEAQRYDESLVIANDIPFLHTPLFIERSRRDYGVSVRSIIALYGSTYVHTPHALDPRRLAWERAGLATPAQYPDVKLGRFSDFMTGHFIERYGVEAAHFVPYRSSLHLESEEYRPCDRTGADVVLQRFNVPLDRPLVLAFGRADYIKGFDLLLNAMAAVPPPVHLVLNVVPYAPDDAILRDYADLIARNGIADRVTLLTGFSRELPAAMCAWHRTIAVVCPSRGEPLSNIPFEVSLWAGDDGPVLLCSNRDGFPEQIEPGENGFLFELDRPGDLAEKLRHIYTLTMQERHRIAATARARVIAERDFHRNFSETLRLMWQPVEPRKTRGS